MMRADVIRRRSGMRALATAPRHAEEAELEGGASMQRFALIAFALVAAAGCDGGDPPTRTKTTKMAIANPYHDRLTTLSELNRSLALRRAVQDAGEACKKIERSAFQGEFKALKMWTASCSDSGDFALFIAPNGDVQVRKCSDAKTLGLPECKLETS